MQNSKWVFLVTCLVAIIKFYSAIPVPDNNQIKSLQDTSLELDDLDLARSDEVETGISLKETSSKSNPPRGKRTVGFLRQLFPNISQLIDRKIQQITRLIFRVVGRLVLRGGNGGGGGGDGGDDGRKISITLPTYPPSEEDEEEDESETEAPAGDSTEAESAADDTTAAPESDAEAVPLESGDNAISESQVITKIARKARDVSNQSTQTEENINNLSDVENFGDDLSDEKINDDDKLSKNEDGKSKRYFFKFGGSGGASGNILFDLIRILHN